MPSAIWHALQTWLQNEFVSETELTQQISDNLLWLKSRPLNNVTLTTVTTTSTSFVLLTGSTVALTSVGGNVMIVAQGAISNSGAANTTFDLAIDTVRQGDATLGLTVITTPVATYSDNLGIVWFTTTPPSAASHNYAIHWKVASGTGSALVQLYAMEIR